MKNFITASKAVSSSLPEVVQISDYNLFLKLSAEQEKTFTVPAGGNVLVFNCSAPFYVKVGETVEIPTVDITDGSAPELSPVAREVNPGDVIHVISANHAQLTVGVYT